MLGLFERMMLWPNLMPYPQPIEHVVFVCPKPAPHVAHKSRQVSFA